MLLPIKEHGYIIPRDNVSLNFKPALTDVLTLRNWPLFLHNAFLLGWNKN